MPHPRITRIITDFGPSAPPKPPLCEEHDISNWRCRRCGRTEKEIEAINVQARLEEDRKPRKQPSKQPVRKKQGAPSARTRGKRGDSASGSSL